MLLSLSSHQFLILYLIVKGLQQEAFEHIYNYQDV